MISTPVRNPKSSWPLMIGRLALGARTHQRILFSTLLLAMAWLAVAAWFASWQRASRTESLVSTTSRELSMQAYETARDIGADLARLRGVSAFLAQMDPVRSILTREGPSGKSVSHDAGKDSAGGNRLLARAAFLLDADVVYIVNAHGVCIASSNADLPESFIGGDFSSSEYFQKALQCLNGEQYVIGEHTKAPGLYFSSPVTADGKFLGAVIAKMEIRNLAPWINKTHSFVADGSGIILLARERSWEFRALPKSDGSGLPTEQHLKLYERSEFGVLDIEPWGGGLRGLHRLDHRPVPYVVTSENIPNSPFSFWIVEEMHALASIRMDCLILFLLCGPGGALLILLAGGLVLYGRKLVVAKSQALQASVAKGQFLATMS
ncbi:MAG: PDC sensor domain-containing protein, partial [Terrimicrobiaceae bacterium]